MNKLIEVRELGVKYGDYTALENVNLDVFNDDFLGVIGQNGGGKTTLIRAILKTITYSGQVNYLEPLKVSGKAAIGYLPQVSNFDKQFPISIKEIVLSGLQKEKGLFKGYDRDDKMKAEELLHSTGIYDIRNKPVGKVSGGQLQRALLCRAIISDPKLLILDEPANFVDNKFEKELYEILRKLNDKMAIIMVSHDIGTISSIVKNIVCVNKHVHRHESNIITAEQLDNYNCPITLISHGDIPHTVLPRH